MTKMKKVTYAQAICEAIDEEMARDKNVLLKQQLVSTKNMVIFE